MRCTYCGSDWTPQRFAINLVQGVPEIRSPTTPPRRAGGPAEFPSVATAGPRLPRRRGFLHVARAGRSRFSVGCGRPKTFPESAGARLDAYPFLVPLFAVCGNHDDLPL
jgi:hypothetical protein